jgi:hypothetical protein
MNTDMTYCSGKDCRKSGNCVRTMLPDVKYLDVFIQPPYTSTMNLVSGNEIQHCNYFKQKN